MVRHFHCIYVDDEPHDTGDEPHDVDDEPHDVDDEPHDTDDEPHDVDDEPHDVDNPGVCHADELFMMFKPHALPVQLVRSEDDR